MWLLMRLTFILTAVAGLSAYNQAINILKRLPQAPGTPLVDSPFDGLTIPPYDPATNSYNISINDERSKVASTVQDKVFPLLHKEDSPRLWRILGDIHMFGNYSVSQNVTEAERYYQKLVTNPLSPIVDTAHAYYVLGFIYSSNLFPEIKSNEALGQLYYQQAADMGLIDAIMVLANRHSQSKLNCPLALMHYTKLAEYGFRWYNSTPRPVTVDGDVLYNIRLPDFSGGIYGKGISELQILVFLPRDHHLVVRNHASEYNMEIDDNVFFYYYYDAADYLSGDYMVAKNITEARAILEKCVDQGKKYAPEYNIHSQTDQYSLGLCHAKLADLMMQDKHPQLKKIGELLDAAVQIYPESYSIYTLLGRLYTMQGRTKLAANAFTRAINRKSVESLTRLGELFTKVSPDEDPAQAYNAPEIYNLMEWLAHNGSTKGLYYYLDFIQLGFAKDITGQPEMKCLYKVYYYKLIVERMLKFFYPSLQTAFDHYIRGNFDQALVLYAMAAAKGLALAQVSAASILYQRPSLADRNPETMQKWSCHRVDLAIDFLGSASATVDDAMVLLGDIYHDGVPGCIEQDLVKAYHYYHKLVFVSRLIQGAYKLGRLYEYGKTPHSNTSDYYKANRYYEMSRESMLHRDEYDTVYQKEPANRNLVPILWALARLRFKLFFSIGSKQKPLRRHVGWLELIKGLGRKKTVMRRDTTEMPLNNHDSEIYDTGDYIVIFTTLLFFFALFIQIVVRQVRRGRQMNQQANPINQNPAPPDQEGNNEENEQGWQFNGPGVQFRRGNFQFQFFAI